MMGKYKNTSAQTLSVIYKICIGVSPSVYLHFIKTETNNIFLPITRAVDIDKKVIKLDGYLDNYWCSKRGSGSSLVAAAAINQKW